MTFASRFEALQRKSTLFADGDWVKAFMDGKPEARNTLAEITTYLQQTGGRPASKEELSIGPYSVEPSNG
jgi:hypothetical protein